MLAAQGQKLCSRRKHGGNWASKWGHLQQRHAEDKEQAAVAGGAPNTQVLFFFNFYFVLGYSQLTNNVVTVSGEQQRDQPSEKLVPCTYEPMVSETVSHSIVFVTPVCVCVCRMSYVVCVTPCL